MSSSTPWSSILGSIEGGASGIGAGIGYAVATDSKEGRARKVLLGRDIAQLKSGRFGLTGGQKNQFVGRAAQEITAQTSGAQDAVLRDMASRGGSGRSGYSTAALTDIAKARADAIRRARADVEAQSQQKASADEQAARQRVEMAYQMKLAAAQQVGSSVGGGDTVTGSSNQAASWSNQSSGFSSGDGAAPGGSGGSDKYLAMSKASKDSL